MCAVIYVGINLDLFAVYNCVSQHGVFMLTALDMRTNADLEGELHPRRWSIRTHGVTSTEALIMQTVSPYAD
jgi:hypothetical protein